MTSDLIRRSELLKKAIGVSEFDDGWERVLRAVPVLDIEMAEAVDAVIVKHGRWEYIADYGCGNCYGYCSVCRSEQRGANATALKMANNFCPNCGAKMDLEEVSND